MTSTWDDLRETDLQTETREIEKLAAVVAFEASGEKAIEYILESGVSCGCPESRTLDDPSTKSI